MKLGPKPIALRQRPNFPPGIIRRNAEKIKLEHIERMSQGLAICQKAAESSPIPGLPVLFMIAKSIVDTVKEARSNIEDSLRLADRVIKLLAAITKEQSSHRLTPPDFATPVSLPAETPSPNVDLSATPSQTDGKTFDDLTGNVTIMPAIPVSEMDENVRTFVLTLEDIKVSLSEVTVRPWYNVAFWSLHDKQHIAENVQKLDEAVVLFQIRGLKLLGDENAHMASKMESMMGSVNKTLHKLENLCVKTLAPPQEYNTNTGRSRAAPLLRRLRAKVTLERERRPYTYMPASADRIKLTL